MINEYILNQSMYLLSYFQNLTSIDWKSKTISMYQKIDSVPIQDTNKEYVSSITYVVFVDAPIIITGDMYCSTEKILHLVSENIPYSANITLEVQNYKINNTISSRVHILSWNPISDQYRQYCLSH